MLCSPCCVHQKLYTMEVPGVEETLRRVCSFRGVIGVIITSLDGTVLRTTMDPASTQQYINCVRPLEERCSSAVRDVDPTNQLQYLRIRSKRFEIMLKTDGSSMLYVIHNPTGTS